MASVWTLRLGHSRRSRSTAPERGRRTRLQRLLSGPNAEIKAATAIRVAVSHYVVRSDDADQFLAQLRHAVGIKQ